MSEPFDLDEARAFVARLDLPEAPGLGVEGSPIVFEDVKKQAVLVGSDIVSFDNGIEAEFREAVSDAALVAQLGAQTKLGGDADPIKWFDTYFDTLSRLGFVIQARDTAEYQLEADGVEVHEAILKVVTAFIGNVPGAVALVALALESLKSMKKDSPLITLFDRESQKAKIGRFQLTLVRTDPSGGLLAEVMAFALEAESKTTQILFFKLKKNRNRLRRSLGSASLNRAALKGLRPILRKKVQAHLAKFVAEIDLGLP
jgi:hypothetical protein